MFHHITGRGKPNFDSNMRELRRYNYDYKGTTKTVESIVIIEKEDFTIDRRQQAFSILYYSASHNGMLLKWQTESVNNMFK